MSKKYIIAVSGGVDSVVLLDMLSKKSDNELIVAHFDHGIRDDSAQDAEFVAGLAKKYGLKFEACREELGQNASEELARRRRYEFLRSIAKEYNAQLVTAHHADDVIETIAINLSRGTGWRGLAVLDADDIIRSLTNMTKSEIIKYAQDNSLTWHEDSTNASDKYLRNRIRAKLTELDDDSKRQLLGLWNYQKQLKQSIDVEVAGLTPKGPTFDRQFFIDLDSKLAIECLRYITKSRLTRPQMDRTLHMIKTILPAKTYQPGDGIEIHFTSRNFTVELLK